MKPIITLEMLMGDEEILAQGITTDDHEGLNMPSSTNYRYRLWCKSCNEFTTHEKIFSDEFSNPLREKLSFADEKEPEFICEVCFIQYTDVFIKDIPEENLLEQRQRFKEQRRRNFEEKFYALTSLQNPLENIFRPVMPISKKIIESDAGLKHEENLIRQERQREKDLLEAERNFYKGLGRNETCRCGSGKKFKHCHLKSLN